MEQVKGNFRISTNKAELQFDVIHQYLSQHSYWAKNISPERLQRALDHSICFGVYDGNKQIGFARVVTDSAVIAYLGDVFILESFRGLGLSKWLMQAIVEHDELTNLRRFVLATKDAHGLYRQYGFTPMEFPERWMERVNNEIYKSGEWVDKKPDN